MDLCRIKCLNPYLCAILIDSELGLSKDIVSKILASTKAKAMPMTHDVAGERQEKIILEYENRDTYKQGFQNNDMISCKIADKDYEVLRVMVSAYAIPDSHRNFEEQQAEFKDSKLMPKHTRRLKSFS